MLNIFHIQLLKYYLETNETTFYHYYSAKKKKKNPFTIITHRPLPPITLPLLP